MRRYHDISCDFNFQVNFSNSWLLQFWRSLILIQIYSNVNRSDIVGWNSVLVVYKRNNGTYDPSSMQDACHMNLVIDLAYRGVSWRVVVFFFNNFMFLFFLFGGGGGERLSLVAWQRIIFVFPDIRAVEKAVRHCCKIGNHEKDCDTFKQDESTRGLEDSISFICLFA